MDTMTTTSDTAVASPSPLGRLAEEIRADLIRREQSREAWAAATLDLCQHLAEARAEFPANVPFGRWCRDQGFGLDPNDRAGAIQMGQDTCGARKVLEHTELRSLRLIYEREFRPSVDPITPPPAPPPKTHVAPPKATGPAPRRSPVLTDAIREIAAARIMAGEPRSSIRQDLGVSDTVLRRVQSEIDGGLLNKPDLAPRQQDKLERAIRSARVEIRAEIEAEVRERIVERGRKYREDMEHREAEAADNKRWYATLINNHKPALTPDEFMLLHLCVRGDASEEKRHAAGVLLNAKRAMLTGQKPGTG